MLQPTCMNDARKKRATGTLERYCHMFQNAGIYDHHAFGTTKQLLREIEQALVWWYWHTKNQKMIILLFLSAIIHAVCVWVPFLAKWRCQNNETAKLTWCRDWMKNYNYCTGCSYKNIRNKKQFYWFFGWLVNRWFVTFRSACYAAVVKLHIIQLKLF